MLGRASWIAVVAGLAAVLGSARAQDIPMEGRYRQTPDVRARYADVPGLDLVTPALAPGREAPTTQAELEQTLLQLSRPEGPALLQNLAVTIRGRNVPLLWLTPDGDIRPEHLRTVGRPIVWILAQQHGDEPAGAEAALALAHAIVNGSLRPLLERLTVVIVPRLNPDGAAAETRDDASQQDLNRDHGTMSNPVVAALHRLVQQVPPDLVVDLHEFSVARRWIEKFGGLQAVDLMLLDATHPMVPAATRTLARQTFAPAIEAAARQAGLSTFPYHTTSTRRADPTIALGGTAPGIARNAFGLMGAVSFLLETRGVGIGTEGYQRRVATHFVAVQALLETAAADPGRLRAAVGEARREIAAGQSPLIAVHTPSRRTIALPLVDPATGILRSVEVVMTDGRQLTAASQRPRPAAYVVLAPATAIADVLSKLGARYCRLPIESELEGEVFETRDQRVIDRRAINPDASVSATLRSARVLAAAGSLVVSTAQAAGTRLATALEPDMPGSLLAMGRLPTSPETNTVPVLRLDESGARAAAKAGAVCAWSHN
jgi:hypothetical protein